MTRDSPFLHQFFKGFADIIVELYDFLSYEPIFAALTVSSIDHFIISRMIELKLTIGELNINLAVTSPMFSYFLHSMSGVAIPYSLMAFVTSKDDLVNDTAGILQILPDINRFVELINDIISYRKEESAGEKFNLIPILALSRGIKTEKVLWQIVEEALELNRCIDIALKSYSVAKMHWKNFRRGYINWHVTEPCYFEPENRQFLLSICQRVEG